MFRKLFEKLRSFTDEGEPFDPSHLGDPVAQLTAWTPAKRGGANFRTRRLVMVTPNRIEFHASIMAKIFFGIFLLGGIGVAAGVSYFHFSTGTFTFTKDTVLPLLAGIVFAVVGGAVCSTSEQRPLFLTKAEDCSGREERLKVVFPTATH